MNGKLNRNIPTRRTGGLPIWMVLVLASMVLGGAAWAGGLLSPDWWRSLKGGGSSKSAPKNLILETASRGPFLVTLWVQGNLDSQRNATLTSLVEGSTTIISIVPEGTLVKQGEVVCELDSSLLREKAKQQEITYTQAGSTMAQAVETVEIHKRQMESDEAAAQLKMDLAKLDLVKFVEGEFPKQEQQLKANLELAREELVRARETYEFYGQQVKKGYRTQNDLEAARIAVKQSEFKVEGAKEELAVLIDYTRPRTIAELEANAKEFQREMERVRLKGQSTLTQYQKDAEAKRLTYEVEKDRLDKMLAQIEACTLRAPQDGEVVYANSNNGGRRSSESVMIEEGAAVRERQAIINLPDITQMKVNCRIHESLIGAIRRGIRARIRIDAYPDEIYNGEISHVSSVPMSGSWPNTDLREYQAEVKLTDDVEKIRKLRPGLTSQVELLIDNRGDVLQVPLQSVVTVADQQVAFVLGPQGVERRSVKVGQSNQSHTEVLDGIADKEKVVMNPRTQFADQISQLQAEYSAEKHRNDQKEAGAAMAPGGIPGGPAPSPQGTGGSVPGGPAGGPDAAPSGPADGPAAGGANSGGPGGNPAGLIARQDQDGDGLLSESEVPERMKARFSEIDKNGDGKLSAEEIAASRSGRPQP